MVKLDFELIRVEDGRAALGESPARDPETGDIWWIDVTGRKLFCLDTEARTVRHWETPEFPGFVVLTGARKPAVGMQTGIYRFDPATAAFERLVPFERDGHRFNDATVDGTGRLWTSTMALDAQPASAEILLVAADLTLKPVAQGLTIPNGLAVDLDRNRLFYSDSHPDIQRIWTSELDIRTAQTGPARLFATTGDLKGRPDGAALDERGHYWIAGVDGGELYAFGTDGQVADTVPVPFPAPTKIAFHGTDGRSVAVTSKQMGEDGGYIALGRLPETAACGLMQPYWTAGALT
ncbi:MAG: SMP-30/gluconolactonase/LRE family protein [Oricola sp.]|nr:SMP-30/gluconolactonase/LRE family protein [Oricola sp.]